jgi:hypothetical protein
VSFQAMAWAVKQKTGDALGRCLLLTLANYADEHGKCWPSLSRLADDCEMHRATVIRKLEALRDLGLVAREQKETPAGTYNVYTLSLTATPSRTEQLPQSHTATPLVAQSDPILSLEPIKEPITKEARKRAAPIPEGFPFEADVRWTLKEHPKLSPWDEAAKFRDYALAHRKTYADWPAAWRTWCRNAERWSAERKRA